MLEFLSYLLFFICFCLTVFVFVNEIQIYKKRKRLLDLDIEFNEKLCESFDDLED